MLPLSILKRKSDTVEYKQFLEETVRDHLDLIYSVCLRRLGNQELAEQACQVVFAIMATKTPRLKSRRKTVAWLFKTTALTCTYIQKKAS